MGVGGPPSRVELLRSGQIRRSGVARPSSRDSCPLGLDSDTNYTQGDSDVVSVSAGIRRHLVRKTHGNVFHCDIAEMRFVGKPVIIQTFS